MPTFGSDADGFSIAFEELSRCLRVKVWGFWAPEVAASFPAAVVDAVRGGRRAAEVLVDAVELKPQRDDAQEAFKTMFAALPALGVTRASITTGNALTKLQLMRLANATPAREIVHFTSKSKGE
jgi:hypothetical protein